ncbi:MAG TPA: quinone-dependent dihydroorotate dehydrogenase [Actinotalea sp.]|nr:quinone-dependent dihydroorotate dehydrogenase [Actinotalea sp.]
MYPTLFRLVLRRLDPEVAHDLAFRLIRAVAAVPVLSGLIRRRCAPPGPPVTALGRDLPGCFGLAAGFDKDGLGVTGLTMLGFAFVEVGTVTPVAQPGNDRPRLWRIPQRQALRNRMGFNNDGARELAERLRRLRGRRRAGAAVIGVNSGKNRTAAPTGAAEDYARCARLLAPWADYLVVNVSSPNTPGLRDLQAVDSLRPVLVAARAASDEVTEPGSVPLLVKISPDLADEDVLAVADLVNELDLAGVVAVNTTVGHGLGEGGLSGPPLLERGLAVVRLLRGRLAPGRTVIGVGGVSRAADGRAYRAAGADLVQGYTGFVYGGPFWAARIHRVLEAG